MDDFLQHLGTMALFLFPNRKKIVYISVYILQNKALTQYLKAIVLVQMMQNKIGR